MSRITRLDPEAATGRAKELLDAVKEQARPRPEHDPGDGQLPRPPSTATCSSAGRWRKGALPAKVREQIALAVAQANGCDYCLAAHSAVGKMVGLTADQIRDSRLGTAVDPKADALIRFARKVVETRGRVSDADLDDVREAGFDDGAIAEVVANVALQRLHQLLQPRGRDRPRLPEGRSPARGHAGRGRVTANVHHRPRQVPRSPLPLNRRRR